MSVDVASPLAHFPHPQPYVSSLVPPLLPAKKIAQISHLISNQLPKSIILPKDAHGRVHRFEELKNRIVRGESILFNNDGLWETIKWIMRVVVEFFGFKHGGLLDPVALDGTFDSRSSISQVARKFFGREKQDDLKLVDFAVDYLVGYETERRWTKGVGESPFQMQETTALIDAIKTRLEKHIRAEKKNLKLSKLIRERKEVRARLRTGDPRERETLTKALASLNYKLREAKKQALAHLGILRLERHFKAFEDRKRTQSDINQRLFNPDYLQQKLWLKESIANWKKGVRPALKDHPDEEKKIEDLLAYPDILKLLRKDPVTRDYIYKMIFRNMRGQCVDAAHIAMQFPATSEEIGTAFLGQREGRLGNLLTFSERIDYENHTDRKEVRYKMNGEDVSLNNRSREIAFSHSYSVTVEEILRSFARKNKEIGEFDCIEGKGIFRLHPLPVDFTKEDWIKEVPVFERINKEECMNRHGRLPQEAFLVIKASRTHEAQEGKVRVDDTHGWIQMIIPDEENPDLFKVYPFGKYADPMPQSFFEKLLFVFSSQLAVIRMDENEFMPHREQQSITLDASMGEAMRVFEKIKLDLLKEKKGDLIFQAQGNNCAAWVKETLEYAFQNKPHMLEQLKDLYEVSWMEFETPGAMKYITGAMQFVGKHISEMLGNIMRIVLSLIGGAWRGLSTGTQGTVRLIYNNSFLSGRNTVPAQLFRMTHERKQTMELASRALPSFASSQIV